MLKTYIESRHAIRVTLPRFPRDFPKRALVLESAFDIARYLTRSTFLVLDAAFGLTVPKRHLLRQLLVDHGGGPVRVGEFLQDPFGPASSSYLARVVSELEGDGYVIRSKGVEDRRHVLVELTPEGRNLMTTMFGQYLTLCEEITAPLSDDEVEQLRSLLVKLRPTP